MIFIELHSDGNPRSININRISAIGCDRDDTYIWLAGDPECFYVDESYDEIKSRLQKAGFVWIV